MAKLTSLPSQAIIDGYKGTLDFYVWMGIPCVRMWPRSPGHNRAPAVQAQWAAFTYASKNWKHLSIAVQQAYNTIAVSTNMTGRDIFMKSYINGAGLYVEEF